jgi:hypothetical protein
LVYPIYENFAGGSVLNKHPGLLAAMNMLVIRISCPARPNGNEGEPVQRESNTQLMKDRLAA